MSRLETPPPQAPLSVPERLSVLAERSRSLAEAPPQPSTVEALRLAIGDLSDEARDGLHDSYSRALARLGALMEVGECLSAESREAAGDLWVFCGEALVLLSQLARSAAPPEEVVDRIIQQSSSSWGDYLAVLEPSDESPDAYPVDLTEEPLPDDIPAFDSQALLRLLAGSGEIDAEKAESSAPEPDSLRWGVGGDGHADSGREIDAEAEATRLDDLPPSHGAAPLAIPALPQRIELDDELREAFLADAMELSERIADLVLTLSRGADLGELRRGLHTLKGAAGCVGLVDLALLVHAVEERLDGSPVAPEVEESLHGMLGYLDGILGLLRRPKRRTAVGPAAEVRPVAAEGSFASASAPVPVDQAPPAQGDDGEATDDGPIRVPSSRLDDLMDLVSELVVRRRLWSAQAEGLKTVAAMVRSCRAGMLRSIDLLHRAGLGRGRGRSGPGPHVDVPGQLRRLEELADDLAVLAESSRAASVPLADHGDALARLSIQLWDELQVLRVVTVRALFQRLTRVAHEAARVEGRKVEVLTLGEETGVDRAVSEKAFEPLLHVVRNAVGHGIESPEERAHAGKPAAGRVTLEARREGNTLILTVSDDGRGLDLRAIESKARRVGLLGEDERPSAEKLRSLIFHPGFSTRAEANAIAGRGVGMDVVAREVGALKGSIELSTEPGKGTRLTIRLPARVALETTMIVRVDGQAFALPVAQIEHVQAMTGEVDGEGRPGEDGPSSGTVRFRDRPIPVLQAREILGVHATPAPSWPKLLVVRHGGGPVGLAVDAVEGTEDLVIKSLGSLLAGHPLISGTSLSLRGEVISILDPSRLHRWIRAASLPEEAPTAWTGIDSSIPDKPRILVVDDSISVRKSLAKGLQLFGFEVDEAADGLEAIGQTRAREYDLVVTDLEMPGLDGFELVAEMRRVATLAGVPVIVASTRSDEETRRRVLALGASRFLGKPVSAEALAGAVFEVLTPSGDRHGAEVAGAEEEPWTVP